MKTKIYQTLVLFPLIVATLIACGKKDNNDAPPVTVGIGGVPGCTGCAANSTLLVTSQSNAWDYHGSVIATVQMNLFGQSIYGVNLGFNGYVGSAYLNGPISARMIIRFQGLNGQCGLPPSYGGRDIPFVTIQPGMGYGDAFSQMVMRAEDGSGLTLFTSNAMILTYSQGAQAQNGVIFNAILNGTVTISQGGVYQPCQLSLY